VQVDTLREGIRRNKVNCSKEHSYCIKQLSMNSATDSGRVKTSTSPQTPVVWLRDDCLDPSIAVSTEAFAAWKGSCRAYKQWTTLKAIGVTFEAETFPKCGELLKLKVPLFQPK